MKLHGGLYHPTRPSNYQAVELVLLTDWQHAPSGTILSYQTFQLPSSGGYGIG